MIQGRDDFNEGGYEGASYVNYNNQDRHNAVSLNRKEHQAPKHHKGDPRIPPPPPMLINTQQTIKPNVAQQTPPHPAASHEQQYLQRNPQFYENPIPHQPQSSRLHRPQKLRIPAVLTTPTPHMGDLGQNVGSFGPNMGGQVQAPPYHPPTTPGIYGEGYPGNQMMPIVQQPGVPNFNQRDMSGSRMMQEMMVASYNNGWVVPLQPPVNCPPGLEYLVEIDQLLIHQKIELFEMITGFETKNKYMIKNSIGQNVFFAAEESGCCNRQCLGESRPFDLNFYDHYGNIVMHMYRSLACSSCCFPCCLQNVEVSAPPGNVIGSIHQNWSMFLPRFSVKDVSGNTLMKIHGPFWTMSCCCNDVNFQIKTADGEVEIGTITKQWSGFIQEAYTDADNFSVSFPLDMDVTAKALLLAAVFLIDFMYYESSNN